jgi:MFS family permease
MNKMEENKTPKNGISKPVFVVSVVSFLNDIASDMIYPIVPIFLTSVLGAPVAILGLIEGIAESTASFLKVASGVASDKLEKRKPFILAGYTLSAISKLFYASAGVWQTVLAGKFMDRLGKGTRTSARDAFIAENTEKKHRGRAFGFHRGMDTLGAVIGPLVCILLLQYWGNDYKSIFLVSLIPTVIALVLLYFFISDKKKEVGPIKLKIPFKEVVRNLPKPLAIFLIINCVFAIGNSSDVFLILRAKDLGASLIFSTLLYSVFSLACAVFSVPAGIISDRIGPRKVMTVGFIIFSLVYLAFGFTQNVSLLWVLFPVYGIYMALTDGVGKAYIANIVSQEHLGTAYGIYQFAIGFCAFFSSLIAGILWTKVGSIAPFIFGGITSLIAAILFMSFSHTFEKKVV